MIEILQLDVRTLAFGSAVSGLLMAATMYGIYLAGMRSRAVIDWFLAGLALGLGYLVGHLLQTMTVPFPSWLVGTVANLLIGLGHALVLTGIQRYLGRPPWVRTLAVALIVLLVASVLIPDMRETLRGRILAHSSFYVMVCGYGGWLLWRAHRPDLVLFRRIVAMILFAYAGILLLRLLYALSSEGLTTSFVQHPIQILAFLSAMVFGFCITMALTVMLFREKQIEILGLARIDPLTGLNNRLSLDDLADHHFEAACSHSRPLALVLFDLDHFKDINDVEGHQAGDQVLRALSQRIDEVIRDSDHAFRFGGEEFLLLLPGAKMRQAERVAERLRNAIATQKLMVGDRELVTTASFGVAECSGFDKSWEDCLRRADRALYRAKRAGRNCVMSAAPPPGD